jgi:hypothetical protein
LRAGMKGKLPTQPSVFRLHIGKVGQSSYTEPEVLHAHSQCQPDQRT